MKILVYGAGVQGSVYAARLKQAGNTVSILARGPRVEQIRTHGIVLRELPDGMESSTPVPVVERLDPQDDYELVIITVRRNQLGDLLPELAANFRVPTFLFLLNNATGFEQIMELLGASRVVAGFPSVGGSREEHIISYRLIPEQPTTLGELSGMLSKRLTAIRDVIKRAGFPVSISRHIDAWLKTHVVFIISVVGALYLAGGDSWHLAKMPQTVRLMVRSIREGFRELERHRVPITPIKFRILFLWLPSTVAMTYWTKYLGSERGEQTIARHARAAVDEMKELVKEWRDLRATGTGRTPTLDQMCTAIDREALPRRS
jgi:2-dehydropantoate 2-reductase